MAISVDEQRGGAPTHAPHAREIFWNLPNTITVLRTAVIPVLLLLPVFSPFWYIFKAFGYKGSRSKIRSICSPLPLAISRLWPRMPKPVMSVQA